MAVEDVTLPAMRRLFADITRGADQAQAKVIAIIDAKHADFVSAADQVGGLSHVLEDLRCDIHKAGEQLRNASGIGTGTVQMQTGACVTQDRTLAAKQRSAVAEHGELKADLDFLDARSNVLSIMLEAHCVIDKVDKLSDAGKYVEAAAVILDIAEKLQKVSAPKSEREPGLMQAAKISYYQRRTWLTTRLQSILLHVVQLRGRSVAICYGNEGGDAEATSLQQVWEALHMLEVQKQRVEQLAEQLMRVVLQPLLDAARKLPAGQIVTATVTRDRARECVVWTWDTAQEARILEERMLNTNDNCGGGMADKEQKRRPPASDVLPVLESLFVFVQEHLSGASADVYSLFGKWLWPATIFCVIQHFDTCGTDRGEALESFETLMQSKELIARGENTLSRHVRENKRSLGEQSHSTVLTEVRNWLMQWDNSLVSVCDATEPGSVTELLAKLPRKESTPSESSMIAATSGDLGDGISFNKELQQWLQQDVGLLRVPTMNVSSATHKLVSRMRNLMDDMVNGNGRAEDLNRLVREICALFAILRPYAQKAQLRTSPHSCAIFFSDCLYLVHALIILQYTHRKQLASDKPHLSIFVDLVPQLRRLGENHFLAMLRHMQEQIVIALVPCDFAAGVAQDRAYIAAEAALGAAVQRVKEAAQGMASALPRQLLHETAGLLFGVVCQDLRGKLFKLQHATPDEVSHLSALLASALNGGRQALAAVGIQTPQKDAEQPPRGSTEIPGWGILALTADLLGSGFSRFMEKRTLLLKTLRKEEILKLMSLSWRDDVFPPQEAWAALNSDE